MLKSSGNPIASNAAQEGISASARADQPASHVPTKAQPWRSVFPNKFPDQSQMRRYGYRKGQVMELAGNAGNFFTDGRWVVECESVASKNQEKCQLGVLGGDDGNFDHNGKRAES